MSSSARAVFFGRPPGIFLLMKWITCSLIGALPTVDLVKPVGDVVGLFPSPGGAT